MSSLLAMVAARFLRLRGGVRVGGERERWARVSEPVGGCSWIDPGGDQVRRVQVPEVVRPDVRRKPQLGQGAPLES